jgi:CheY-like chemotaxis protein
MTEVPMARILLADDDAATRDFVKRSLSAEGHEVIVTPDGLEALERLVASSGSIDLLISDVQMPSLDGISLAEKAIQASPALKVVLMSGFAGELGRAEHLKPQLAQVISKPFTLEQIRAVVRKALAR